jgi:hypothetical protein
MIDFDLIINIVKTNINNYVLLQFKNSDFTFSFF